VAVRPLDFRVEGLVGENLGQSEMGLLVQSKSLHSTKANLQHEDNGLDEWDSDECSRSKPRSYRRCRDFDRSLVPVARNENLPLVLPRLLGSSAADGFVLVERRRSSMSPRSCLFRNRVRQARLEDARVQASRHMLRYEPDDQIELSSEP
jgi:hypothetical protein